MSNYHAATLAAEIMARALQSRRSEPDIRPNGETETVPECRVLYRNGKPVDAVLVDRPRPMPLRGIAFTPKNGTYVPPAERIKGRRSDRKSGPIPKDPQNPVKRRGGGRGMGWLKIPGLTMEAVMADILAGLSIREIAEKRHASTSTVSDYLVHARKASAEFCRAEAAMRLCGCGRTKWTHQPICAHCRKRDTSCSAQGCENRARVKGLCSRHYLQARRMPRADAEPGTGSRLRGMR